MPVESEAVKETNKTTNAGGKGKGPKKSQHTSNQESYMPVESKAAAAGLDSDLQLQKMFNGSKPDKYHIKNFGLCGSPTA